MDKRHIKANARDDVQNLRIALQLITRTRCHMRAGWDTTTSADRGQRKRLEKASEEIRDVMLELEGIYLTEQEQKQLYSRVI